jgi:hypothetical protein
MKLSAETTPGRIPSNELIAKLDAVSVTHLPGQPFDQTANTVIEINQRAGKAVAFPHLAARNFWDEYELTHNLERMGKLHQVLIIGGSQLQGSAFFYADDVYRILNETGHTAIKNCAVDPNRDSYAHTLRTRYNKYDRGFTQLCLNTACMRGYSNRTVHCLPSRATATGLAKFIKLCGIKNSLKGMWTNRNAYRYLDGGRFDTHRFWQDIGLPDVDVHLYNFGELEKTIDQIRTSIGH